MNNLKSTTQYYFNKMLLKTTSLVVIGAFLFTNLAWVRPQYNLGQAKGAAILTGARIGTVPLSPGQNLSLRPLARAEKRQKGLGNGPIQRSRAERKFEPNIKIISLGGVNEPGRSCFYVKLGQARFVLDVGQGVAEGQPLMPQFNLIDDGLDFIVISHPHADHMGCLPELIALLGDIPIYTNAITRKKMGLLLNDPNSIEDRRRKRQALAVQGISSKIDVVRHDIGRAIKNIHAIEMNKFYQLGNLKIILQPAGHILGSSSITVATPYGNILYTGDLSRAPTRTTNGIENPVIPIDMLICESTYGGRTHSGTWEMREHRLVDIVTRTLERNGTVLIPTFSLGRVTEIALALHNAKEQGLLPSTMPIYIDGSAAAMFAIDMQFSDLMPGSIKLKPFGVESGIFRVSESMRDRIMNEPCCIITTSGMMVAGTLSGSVYAPKMLNNSANTVLFVGYQAGETPGRKLLEAKPGDFFIVGDKKIPIYAEIASVSFSAHGDHADIMDFITGIKSTQPFRIMLVHGEKEAREALYKDLRSRGFEEKAVEMPDIGSETILALRANLARHVKFDQIKTEKMPAIKGMATGYVRPAKIRLTDADIQRIQKERIINDLIVDKNGFFRKALDLKFGPEITKEQRDWAEGTVTYFEEKGYPTGYIRTFFQQLFAAWKGAGLDVADLYGRHPQELELILQESKSKGQLSKITEPHALLRNTLSSILRPVAKAERLEGQIHKIHFDPETNDTTVIFNDGTVIIFEKNGAVTLELNPNRHTLAGLLILISENQDAALSTKASLALGRYASMLIEREAATRPSSVEHLQKIKKLVIESLEEVKDIATMASRVHDSDFSEAMEPRTRLLPDAIRSSERLWNYLNGLKEGYQDTLSDLLSAVNQFENTLNNREYSINNYYNAVACIKYLNDVKYLLENDFSSIPLIKTLLKKIDVLTSNVTTLLSNTRNYTELLHNTSIEIESQI